MKNLLLILVLLLIGSVYSQSKSYKRGVSYGYHSAPDMQKASANISWWYNWATQPDAVIRSRYQRKPENTCCAGGFVSRVLIK